MRPVPSPVRALLLGTEARQQMRVSQALLALVVYLVFAVVQQVEVLVGLMDEAASWPLTAWNLAGGFGFYAFIRSGLNLRLRRHRALTTPQALWAMVGVSWSYGITGPARGGVILILLLILSFGMFSLSARQARTMAAAAFAMIGSVMVYKALTDPAHYDPRVEALHGIFGGVVIAAVSAVSVRVGRLRLRLEEQRAELGHALLRIQALAISDDLTGLINRRAAMERMRKELAAQQRPGLPMCLALIDIDHFKRVNDTHGHATGDAVLRRFAERALAIVRAGDTLARWGGEEFLLVMPATTAAEALRAVARLRERLRQEPFDDIAPGLVVSFSAGLAVCAGAADLESAIERADKAMYAAKRAGRDRTVGATEAPAPLREATPG